MKITNVETFALKHQLPRAIGPSVFLYQFRESMLVKISTDAGLVGWGETYFLGGARAVIQEVIAPLLIGQDPTACRRLWRQIWPATFEHGFATAAVDMALHDLWGKAWGVSIGQLYGGALREQVPVYASALSYVEGSDPSEIWIAEASGLVAQGFNAIKMRIGRYPPAHELPLIAELRRALPAHVRLMADANAAYTLPTAINVGRELERIGLHWFEEPLPEFDHAGYEVLASHLDIAIAGGEALQSRFRFKELITRRAVDIVQPDVAICGGIGECLFVADFARLWGVQCMPHCWGGALMIAATVHVLSVLPDPTGGPAAETPMLELDTTENPFRTELLVEPLQMRDGCIVTPTGPGLGVEVNEDVVRKYAVN